MTEKLTIVVDASQKHPDQMTVQDVFQHVIELFQLVDESDPESMGQVKWRLLSASMNSPFTVIAEAVPVNPNVVIEAVALRQKEAFSRNYSALKQGHIPPAWSGHRARDTVSKVLARNRNGIGLTKIEDVGEGPIVITKDDADVVSLAISPALEQLASAEHKKTKQQIGSIEGILRQVGTYYGQPAIQLQERKTHEAIWCVVPAEFQHEVSEETSVEDVWKGSRVRARGKIFYGGDGRVSRVEATSVRRVQGQAVSDGALVDSDFTGGLTAAEYLERLRDGLLG
jgi:hypothetical protein